ncbi:hypothetical protein PanWU01x14_238110 [Parasponia andersonii]|uniref:Uncharacterized protein n=1 Tax=Parasponia andersonii TaxID=3476 RepID=A0A2P5BHK2_PARAD|nr:hypothetical protein PanWU01x14_238110 [Parasponia andersonii]
MRKAEQGGRSHAHRSDRAESSSPSWKALNQDQSLTPDLGLTSSLSTSQPQNLEPISNSVPKMSNNGPNPTRVLRKNQRGSSLKPRFVDKSEVDSLDSDVGSSNEVGFLDSEVGSSNHEVGYLESEVGSLSIDERENGQVEKVEKDEREEGGNGLGSKSEVAVEEEEESSNDVMDILEELRLSTEEPEL